MPGGAAPLHAATRPASNRGLLAFLLAYPLLLPVAFYATWLIGRLSLGYWPQPGPDDPAQLGGAAEFAHGATLTLVTLGLPLFVLAACAGCCAALRDPARHRCLACAAAAGTFLLIAGVVFLRLDPNRVAAWFFG